jgi:hypothetical protein
LLNQHAAAPNGTYRLTATYADKPRHGIGPLADTAVVLLRSPHMLARDVVDMKYAGQSSGTAPDSTTRMMPTIYSASAYLAIGRVDLTGITSVSFDLRSPDSRYPYTLELRADSATGPLVGSVEVRPTVGNAWYSQSMSLSATGERALYAVFRSSVKGLGQFNSLVTIDGLRFEKR